MINKSSKKINIRKLEVKDEARWHRLWDEYCKFYEREPSEEITQYLWDRIMNSSAPLYSIVAVDEHDYVIGIANYIIHENTSTLTPVCYLQDLFVGQKTRSRGVGRALIDWLVREMEINNWSRLYWNTKENNYRARTLYDSYTPHSGFLKYVVINEKL